MNKVISDNSIEQDFLEAIHEGQKMAKEAGYRVSAVLLKLLTPLDEDITREALDFVRSTLRRDDAFFSLGNGLFGAILPATHEAGGEAAGMRLKRFFQHAVDRVGDSVPQISVGVVSIGPEDRIAPERILHLLRRDLELDMECLEQEPDQETETTESRQAKESRPSVLIVSDQTRLISDLKKKIENECVVVTSEDVSDLENILLDQPVSAFILIKSRPGKEIIEDVALNFLRSDRRLDPIFKILIHKEGRPESQQNGGFDCVLEWRHVDEVARIVGLGARIGRLQAEASKAHKWTGICDSVSKATHKLNQPLQVILGKIEIFILDYEDDLPELTERLKEIRKQALKAAEINHKIARLVKV